MSAYARWAKMWVAACCFLLAGCWDQAELSDRSFVMGAAIDLAEDGRIKLTTQVYKPAPNMKMGRQGGAYVNIVTIDDNLFEAVRDIPAQLGRKAQWSHMRVIIVSDAFAKQRNLLKTLDFFYRDHETRLTSTFLIASGEAGQYLEMKPLVENTISQQIRESQMSTAREAAKSVRTNLLELFRQLRSETGNSIVPYLKTSEQNEKHTAVQGAVLVGTEGLFVPLSPRDTEALKMLQNRYTRGVVKIACEPAAEAPEGGSDIVEMMRLRSSMKVEATKQRVEIRMQVHIQASIGELQCADVVDEASERRFVERVEQALARSLKQTMEGMQAERADVLGAGNYVYAHQPRLWAEIKKDWDDRFAEADVQIDVDVSMTNTGMITGKSAGSDRR